LEVLKQMAIQRADEISWEMETDVVVVGAGGCGLISALIMAQNGLEVLLVEKASTVGGNTAMSAGFIPAAGTRFQRRRGIMDTPEAMAKDILAKNGYQSDPVITMLLAHKTAEVVEWMSEEIGVPLDLVTEVRWPGFSADRTHGPPSRSGEELVHHLYKAVRKTSSILMALNSPVVDLVVDETGAVVGVIGETWRREAVHCKKTMLACNGFAGNPQMVARHIPEIADAVYFGAEGNTGDGIRWGMELDAALDHMTGYQAHASLAYPESILLTWRVIAMGGIMVNKEGRRFGDETIGYSPFAQEVLRQPDKLGFHVFGQRAYEAFQGYKDFRNCIESGAIKTASSLPELAGSLHVDENNLVDTVGKYNLAITGSSEDPFGRTRFMSRLEPPFYGARVTAALFHTQGGLRVNSNAQVLRTDGKPIPNLYAGGGTAVGISGFSPSGYNPGNGLTAALGLGKVAGDHIVSMLKSAS
jgi:fumarate reductase flavoprotein subunit